MITTDQLARTPLTYDQAQRWFDQGFISADQWAGWRTAWRRSAFHYSSLAAECEGPQDPEVESIAAEIAQAHQNVRAVHIKPATGDALTYSAAPAGHPLAALQAHCDAAARSGGAIAAVES